MNSLLQKMITRALLCICFTIGLMAVVPEDLEASHYRYGTLSYVSTDVEGEVEFRMKVAFRAAFFGTPPVGNTIGIGFLHFGDGTSVFVQAEVTNLNIAEDWLEAEFTYKKKYSGTGPFTVRWPTNNATSGTCCRIGNIYGGFSNRLYKLETVVSPYSGNNSPVSNQFPVVNVSEGNSSSFLVVGADPDGDNLRFRFATGNESSIQTLPPGLSIDQNSGLITWDNTGLDQNTFYPVQVMIEDLDENGNVKSKTPVDFMMKIIEAQLDLPSAPVCSVMPEGPYNVGIGNSVSFDVTASTDGDNVNISLAAIGLPSGSSMSPGLPLTAAESVSSELNWTPSSSQTGSFILTFSATDQFGQQTQCGATINVTSNQPPIADAGDDQTVECSACEIQLDGSGSSDPDGDDLTYSWAYSDSTWTGVDPVIKLPLGEHKITLTVDDGKGETDSDDVTITVVDTTPPELITVSEPYILWPPNHQYHTFDISDFIVSVTDLCDVNVSENGVVITRVTSDEPENQTGSNNGRGRNGGGGDGNTINDIVISDDGRSVDLRAERLGGGNGRVYTIYVGVVDASGNIAESSFEVHVPQNPNRAAINDGASYEVTGLTPQAQSASGSMITSADNSPVENGSAEFASGMTSNSEIVEMDNSLPETFRLNQNYPNPFNPSTIIGYQVPGEVHVTIEVFDITGKRIASLVNETKSQGSYEVSFDASHLTSGIYLYRIIAGKHSEMRRMTLIK